MPGLSAVGFEKKKLSEIIEELEDALKAQFGDEIDLRPESVFSQIIGVLSLPISEMWEELENVYLAFDPDYAEGVSLDALAALTGLTRIEATNTEVDAILYGTEGTEVANGVEARNSTTQDLFSLKSAVTIEAATLVATNISVDQVQNSTAYTITVAGTDYTYTSDSSATEAEILSGLETELAGATQTIENTDGEIIIKESDLSNNFSLAVTSNLTIEKIGSAGTFVASEKGAIVIPSEQLDEIVTSVSGWQEVINPANGTTGLDLESDANFRLRRKQSVSFPSIATGDSLLSKLLQDDEIQAAVVYENNTDSTDANGVPAHSIWIIVEGGEDEDIADLIYKTKAGGIGTHGDVTVNIESSGGQEYPIKFERPTGTQIYIDLTITEKEGYVNTTPDDIKTAIVNWVTENQTIGEDLIYSRLFTPINSVPGFEVTAFTLGESASPTGEASLSADIDEIFKSEAANITITVS